MATGVPMDVAANASMVGKGSQVMICLVIAAYICQPFQRAVSLENSERLPCKKYIEREMEGMAGLVLAEMKRAPRQAI